MREPPASLAVGGTGRHRRRRPRLAGSLGRHKRRAPSVMSNARSAPVIVKAADSRTDKGQPTSSPRELAAGRSRAGGGSDAAARSSCSASALSPFLVLWARMRCDTSSSAALSSGGGGAPGVGGPFGIWCETVEPCRCSRWMPSLPRDRTAPPHTSTRAAAAARHRPLPTQPSERMTASVPPMARGGRPDGRDAPRQHPPGLLPRQRRA